MPFLMMLSSSSPQSSSQKLLLWAFNTSGVLGVEWSISFNKLSFSKNTSSTLSYTIPSRHWNLFLLHPFPVFKKQAQNVLERKHVYNFLHFIEISSVIMPATANFLLWGLLEYFSSCYLLRIYAVLYQTFITESSQQSYEINTGSGNTKTAEPDDYICI